MKDPLKKSKPTTNDAKSGKIKKLSVDDLKDVKGGFCANSGQGRCCGGSNNGGGGGGGGGHRG